MPGGTGVRPAQHAWPLRRLTPAPSRTKLASFPELEDDLVLSNEAELVSGDALDGRRVVAELLYLDPERADVAFEVRIVGLDVGQRVLERSHAREPLWLENEDGRTDRGKDEDADRQGALEGDGELHAGMVTMT